MKCRRNNTYRCPLPPQLLRQLVKLQATASVAVLCVVGSVLVDRSLHRV